MNVSECGSPTGRKRGAQMLATGTVVPKLDATKLAARQQCARPALIGVSNVWEPQCGLGELTRSGCGRVDEQCLPPCASKGATREQSTPRASQREGVDDC